MANNESDASGRPSRFVSKEELREVRRQFYRRRRQPRYGRPSKEELREEAREMHREDPSQSEEEWYADLEFAHYAFPTPDERIAMLWNNVRRGGRRRDLAELMRLLARGKKSRKRNRR